LDRPRVDILAIVSVLFILFLGSRVLLDRNGGQILRFSTAEPKTLKASNGAFGGQAQGAPAQVSSPFSGLGDPEETASPYDHYTLTQGLHGFSYNHMAVDITDGEGATIMSPINGMVTAHFVDDLGNTTLLIENDIYMVTLLHGIYTVSPGDKLVVGQTIGEESNQGNTYDAFGRSCRGRDCGYHTHLNIFNKQLGSNVDPLPLIGG